MGLKRRSPAARVRIPQPLNASGLNRRTATLSARSGIAIPVLALIIWRAVCRSELDTLMLRVAADRGRRLFELMPSTYSQGSPARRCISSAPCAGLFDRLVSLVAANLLFHVAGNGNGM